MRPENKGYLAKQFESWLRRNVRLWFWILGFVGGFFQLLAERNLFYNDIIPYLNLAEIYVVRGWRAGINGFWSPLYSWLIAPLFAFHLANPNNELCLIHLLNFLILLLTMASFDFFVRTLSAGTDPEAVAETRQSAATLILAQAAAYLIFLRLTLNWLTNSTTTPDLAVACLIFLAAAFLVRLSRGEHEFLNSSGLGVTFAFAYFGKYAVFPLACFTFLLLPLIGRQGRPRRVLLVAPVIFLCVAAPVLLTLSAKERKPSFGESGRVAFLMEENAFPPYFFGEDVGGPSEPRGFLRTDTTPSVFVFKDTFPGSYFPSTYPAIWYRGFHPKFNLRNQLLILRESLKSVGEMLGSFGEVPLALLALIYICPATSRKKMLANCWFVILLPIVMILIYSLVFVVARYLAGFFVLFWVSILIAAARGCSKHLRQARPILYALLFVLLAGFAQRTGRQAVSAVMSHPVKDIELAKTMISMGLPANSKIGVIGHVFDMLCLREGRYSIVAAIPESRQGSYLGASEATAESVDQAFQAAGAKALLMRSCSAPIQPGWQNVRDSDLYLKFINAPPVGGSR